MEREGKYANEKEESVMRRRLENYSLIYCKTGTQFTEERPYIKIIRCRWDSRRLNNMILTKGIRNYYRTGEIGVSRITWAIF